MKKEGPFIMPEDVLREGENKYQTIVKISTEIKRRLELGGERDDTLILKVLDEFKKNGKDSTGNNG